ncbi:hypothetical protein [Vescimonas sp.]|uniref:hypothetical protein n=1 Tax=Vescimonas sp. TaxID=2892404 RepID=UPI00307C982C
MENRMHKSKLTAILLVLCLALSLVPILAFAESGAYAVKFYPGEYGTMRKNDQIPFVYYGIDDDVNKPYYYKLNISETDIFGFAGSIMDTLLPNSGYEFAYWTADATVYQAGSGTAIPAGTALSSDQIQNRVTVKSDVTFTAHFRQISEYPGDSEISTAEIVGATLSYNPGDAPRATAAVAAADQGKYRIADEWWQELNENDEPVAIWHSDDGIYSTLPTITAFESGKKYVYSVLLLPERGYDFGREVAATVNGSTVTAVPGTDGYLSLPNVKTITPTAASHTHSYGTAWKCDGTNHWHECACGDKADTAAHTFKWVTDKEATATEKGSKHEECTVCGYKKAAVEIPATGSGNGSASQPTKPGSTDSPQTGDSSSVLWLAILCISGVLGVLGVAGKKKMP